MIRCERLDRLALHRSGGIYFGDDLAAQLRLCHPRDRSRERELRTLRFCSQGWCFAFLRKGLQRYPIEHSHLSRPRPGDTRWLHPKAPHVLEPGSPADGHPYPVELDLPSWTVAADIDLRTWLLAFEASKRAHYNVMTAGAEGHGARSGAAAAGLSRAAPAD